MDETILTKILWNYFIVSEKHRGEERSQRLKEFDDSILNDMAIAIWKGIL
jgi:hypothetical protein